MRFVERGCLPRNPREETVRIPLASETGIIPLPQDKWEEHEGTKLAQLVFDILDQQQTDMCASFATIAAVQLLIRQQTGMTIWLSAPSVYNAIQRGPGGTTIYSNLRQISEVGILPATHGDGGKSQKPLLDALGIPWEHAREWNGYNVKPPQTTSEKATAALFRVSEWFDVASINEMVAVLARPWPCVYGRRGHAICGIGYTSRIVAVGSWGEEYDREGGAEQWASGFHHDDFSMVSSAIRQYGAFAPRSWNVPEQFNEYMMGS